MTTEKPRQSPLGQDPQEIGHRIKILREALGLTQSAFGVLIGKDSGTISRWERGDFPAHIDRRLREICLKTEASGKWLVKGEGEMFEMPGQKLGARESLINYSSEPGLDTSLLAKCIETLLLAVEKEGAHLGHSKLSVAIAELYGQCRREGRKPSQELVAPYIRLMLA